MDSQESVSQTLEIDKLRSPMHNKISQTKMIPQQIDKTPQKLPTQKQQNGNEPQDNHSLNLSEYDYTLSHPRQESPIIKNDAPQILTQGIALNDLIHKEESTHDYGNHSQAKSPTQANYVYTTKERDLSIKTHRHNHTDQSSKHTQNKTNKTNRNKSKFTNVYTLQDFYARQKTKSVRGLSHDNKRASKYFFSKFRASLKKTQSKMLMPPSTSTSTLTSTWNKKITILPKPRSNISTTKKAHNYKRSFNFRKETKHNNKNSHRDSDKLRSKHSFPFSKKNLPVRKLKATKVNTSTRTKSSKTDTKGKVAGNQPNTYSKQQSNRDSDTEPQLIRKMDRLKKFWYRRKPHEKGPSQTSLNQTTVKHKKPGYEDAQELDLKRENDKLPPFRKSPKTKEKHSNSKNLGVTNSISNDFVKSTPIDLLQSRMREVKSDKQVKNSFLDSSSETEAECTEKTDPKFHDQCTYLDDQKDKMQQVTNDNFYSKKYSGSRVKSYDSNHSPGDTKKAAKFVFDSKAYSEFGSLRQINRIRNHENMLFQNLITTRQIQTDFTKKKEKFFK